jgi:hypothetical protein
MNVRQDKGFSPILVAWRGEGTERHYDPGLGGSGAGRVRKVPDPGSPLKLSEASRFKSGLFHDMF